MTDTPTHRVYSDGFVLLPNATVNDERLSFRALGLLGYMLGRPPSWRFAADRLAQPPAREGRDAVKSALRELEARGYYRRTKKQDDGGQWLTVTEVASRPELLPPTTGNQSSVNRQRENRRPVNRRPVNQSSMSGQRATTKNQSGEVGSGSRDE